MITLITGVPGTGKTCYMIDFLLQAEKENRPIFVHGIPDLKIPHTPVYCSALSCTVCGQTKPESGEILLAEEWDHWAPDGAFLCFDEVQNVYRPRKQGTPAPSSVMAFETHRHSGIDFFLLSQSPMLFDSNVRRLIGRHIHLKSNWSGRNQYEWSECQESVKSTSGAVKSSYTLNKKNFGKYKSAELHTKQKRKIPAAVFALVALLLVGGFLGTRIYGSFTNKDLLEESGAVASGLPPAAASQSTATRADIGPSIFDYEPVVINHPESAPAFADLVQVVSYPRIAACVQLIASGDCKCYSQQGTRIDVEYSYCRNFVRERPFDPYKPDLDSAISPKRQQRPSIVSDSN